MTKQLKERIITLNVGNPRQLSVIYTIEVADGIGKRVETLIHSRLGYHIPNKQENGKGEWFLVDKDWLDTVIFGFKMRDCAMLDIDANITHHQYNNS